jgi:hypothetical protein
MGSKPGEKTGVETVEKVPVGVARIIKELRRKECCVPHKQSVE